MDRIFSLYPPAKKYKGLDKLPASSLYEIAGMLQNKDPDQCKDILDKLREAKYDVTIKSPYYDQYRDAIAKETFTPRVDATGKKCKACGSRRTYAYQVQTRSADEGMTTINMCVDCGAKF